MDNPSFSEFLSQYVSGPVQKLAIDAGFTCPNRDGRVGRGGCSYCNNYSYSPQYCDPHLSVTEQIQRGKNFSLTRRRVIRTTWLIFSRIRTRMLL